MGSKEEQSAVLVLDETEAARKKRNSEAAKRSRQRKHEKTQELKEKNEALEKENNELAEQKNELERKAEEYKLMIMRCREKGCKLPPEFETLWNQEIINEIPTFTDTHNVATLAESSSSVYAESAQSNFIDKPPLQRDDSNGSTVSVSGPTALFSGIPLPSKASAQTKSTRLSTSSSSTGSSPPKVTLSSINRSRDFSRSTSHEIPAILNLSTSSNQRLDGSNRFKVASFDESETDLEANGMEDAGNYTEGNAVAVSYVLNNPSTIGIQSSQDYGNQYECTTQLDNEETDQSELIWNPADEGESDIFSNGLPTDFLGDDAELINKNPEEYQTHKTGENKIICHSHGRNQDGSTIARDYIETPLLGIVPDMSASLCKQIMSYGSPANAVPASTSDHNNKPCMISVIKKDAITPVSSQFQQLNLQRQYMGQLGTTAATNRGSTSDQFSNMRVIYASNGSVQADMSLMSVLPALQTCPENELPHSEANQDQLGWAVLPAVSSFQGPQQGIQGQLYNNHGSQYNNHVVNSSNVATAIGFVPKQAATNNRLLSPVADIGSYQYVPVLINIPPENSSHQFTQHQHYISASNVSNVPNDCPETDMSAELLINNPSVANPTFYPVVTPTVAHAVTPTTTFSQSAIEEPHSGTLGSCDFTQTLQDLPSLNFSEMNSEFNLFDKKPSHSPSI